MANDVEIKAKISVETANAGKSVNEMLDGIKATKKALAEAKVGSQEYQKAQADLSKQTKELNSTLDKSGGSFSKLKETLGNTIPGFQGATAGASGLGKQLWLLVANPIVAIVAALVAGLMLLYKAFASTNDGADKLDQIMAGIGSTIEVLRDRVLKVGEAIVKFFSGDFKGAMEAGRASVKGIGQEIADEFAAAAQATKTLQDLEDAMRNIGVNRAKLNRDLAQAKEIMNNSDATFAQRRAALNQVREAEKKQNADELAAAKTKYEALKLDADRTKHVSDEKLNALADAEAAYYNLQASSASQVRALNKMDNMLRKEEQAKVDAANKAREEARKKKVEEEQAKRKAAYQAERDEVLQTQQTIASISAIDKEDKKKREAEKDEVAQKEIDRASFAAQMMEYNHEVSKRISNEEVLLKRAQYQEVSNIMTNAMAIFGKQTIAGKALAVATALMNTYSGATDALRAKSTLPSPFDVAAKVANVALVLATGFKSVKAINAVQVPGGGGSVPSMASVSASAPLTPQTSSTSLNSGSIQGIGNAASGGVNRSFVLDADIKNNRERAEAINRAARLS